MAGPVVAVVVAGGRGRRLGGVDKGAVDAGRGPLLEGVLAAAAGAGAATAVVVGDPRPMAGADLPLRWVREDPPGGGPLHAVAAGVAVLAETSDDARVLVLAVDLPAIGAPALQRLLAALDGGSVLPGSVLPGSVLPARALAALAVDADGRDQPLVAAWRLAALRRALAAAGPTEGGRVGALLQQGAVPPVAVVRVPPPADDPRAWADCDTPQDRAAARAAARRWPR